MSVQPPSESRRNPLPLPPGLARRNLPHFVVEELAKRAVSFESAQRGAGDLAPVHPPVPAGGKAAIVPRRTSRDVSCFTFPSISTGEMRCMWLR